MSLSDFSGHFRFNAETVTLNVETVHNLAAKYLVASFHIAEIEIGTHVTQLGQQPIADRMPEKEYPLLL